jgi:hypothetical protein
MDNDHNGLHLTPPPLDEQCLTIPGECVQYDRERSEHHIHQLAIWSQSEQPNPSQRESAQTAESSNSRGGGEPSEPPQPSNPPTFDKDDLPPDLTSQPTRDSNSDSNDGDQPPQPLTSEARPVTEPPTTTRSLRRVRASGCLNLRAEKFQDSTNLQKSLATHH